MYMLDNNLNIYIWEKCKIKKIWDIGVLLLIYIGG